MRSTENGKLLNNLKVFSFPERKCKLLKVTPQKRKILSKKFSYKFGTQLRWCMYLQRKYIENLNKSPNRTSSMFVAFCSRFIILFQFTFVANLKHTKALNKF